MANIDYICRADHAADATNSAPTITLHEGLWSYCPRTADRHAWERVPTTRTLAEIQMTLRVVRPAWETEPPATRSTRTEAKR